MKNASFGPRPSAPSSRLDPAEDEVSKYLHLAARLYAAQNNLLEWTDVLRECRDWFDCREALQEVADNRLRGPDDLEALAGRVTHCAEHKIGPCGQGVTNALKRFRCAAFAAHLHEAATAYRHVLRAFLFDQMPPTWIIDRDCRVLDSNAAAKERTAVGDILLCTDGRLFPGALGGGSVLRRVLSGLSGETRFTWPAGPAGETALLLRPIIANGAIAATLLAAPLSPEMLGTRLAQSLSLTRRQSELAAHLLAGNSVTEAARQMHISRHTANEHLAALLRHTGQIDRKGLVSLLFRAACG